MRAIRILQHGAFMPDDVDRLQQAFNLAWTEIALSVPEHEAPRAREILATVIVSAGNVSDLDSTELCKVGLRQFSTIRKSVGEPSDE